ncbi:efflux RND transporter permease subunit [uncultured Nitrosomonas sp.]|uniref:efflux RND transporter permease subunit n=1 Tax=uncultured Nitrosomonas sp. TaxID=156424 RepID=UPI0025E0325C|nr:efflux RND transporter permease subunit [uncultured Nitrosomonas sp.]
MNIAQFFIERRVITLVLAFVMLGAGFLAFENLSRLEDPEFTIKEALVVTSYPGASAAEVEEEVSDRLEKAVQKLGQLKRVESRSERGLSTLTVTIKDQYDKSTLPQVWDELRRKISDVQHELPPGVGPSLVIDDYGDVYGIFIAVLGDEYSYSELKDVVDLLRRELLLVQDVAKIDTFGERIEAIYVELNRDRMSKLGISPDVVINQLRHKNLVAAAGRIKIGSEFITLQPTGEIKTVEQFGAILVSDLKANQVYLSDIARIWRGYVEPQQNMIYYDGKPAIGLGISTASGGNVVSMGAMLTKRLEELQSQIPLGIEFGMVSVQSEAVEVAIQSFVLSLIEAVAIVIVVLLLFMGMRSGLLIGFVLVLTIAASFIFLAPMEVALERISLGALIIALGMLVDNAIVVVDGVLVRVEEGQNAKKAAVEVVNQTAVPLLGATIIAVLGFAAIGTSDDSTGEFCRSLFQVVLVSLLLSWVIAVTITPLLCVMFIKKKQQSNEESSDSSGGFYNLYKKILIACIRRKSITISAVIMMFVSALWGFQYIEQSFFPPSTRPQFMVDLWFPQGTHIEDTQKQTEQIESYIGQLDNVTHVTSLIGQGGLRFLLTYQPEKPNSAYVQLLVDIEDTEMLAPLLQNIEDYLSVNHPDIVGYTSKFQLGPGSTGKVQARFSGTDPDVLRALADQALAINYADPNSKGIRTDWRQRVKVIKPLVAEEQANLNGITRQDIASTLLEGFQGRNVGTFRDGDLLLPIILRAEELDRSDIRSFYNLQIWSPAAGTMIPLRQVVPDFEVVYEDEIIMRRDRKRTITVFSDPVEGPASDLFARVRPQIENIELPIGYELEWGGEYEDSADAQTGLKQGLPIFFLMMVLITIMLFNSLRQPLIIWAVVPLALIGVTIGLLMTNQPFGFMSLLGILSLAGMLIKNAIVLIDEINLQKNNKELITAIVDSGASRLRPVAMAALTTALGMIPLLFDAFFAAMAVTIIAGLVFATVLTMILVPVLYSIFYNVKPHH